MNSLKKSMIRSTRKQFSKSSIKNMQRRKSSTLLNLKKFISCNNIVRLSQDKASNKNSHKDCYSIKKHYFDTINTSIPEESESCSNETNKNKDTNNNDYYLKYIKKLYENESHLNKETFLKSPSSKKTSIKKYDDSNKKFYKRRNSAVNDQLLTLNFHKKFCVEKGQKIPQPNKMKSAKLNNLLKNKKLSGNDVLKIHTNISKPKDKKKSKSKSKSKVSNKDKSKNKDKKSKNNSNSKTKVKEVKIKVKESDTKSSTKAETINNLKIKNKTLKNLFCCLVNENNLSTEND